MADPAEPQTPLPEALGERGRALVAAWREAAGGVELPADVERELPRVFAWSEFIATSCTRDPALLPSLAADGLARARGPGEMVAACSALVAACADEAGFMAALRRLRRRELVRIAWRDLAGRASLPETLAELTAFADAAVQGALAFAVRSLEPRYGTPRSESGEAQELVVLGMGKLGGGELNFSSDIDLIFLFPEGGETDGRRPVANEEYFTRLGQTLIRLLDAPTVDGFVFRVDMRLRPFGDSGPLVASFGAFEDYLQQHGRDWERYAYVKARALTGVERYASVYDDAVRPFVYRRYLDFGVFESLREMKDLISREVARREMQDNVKLGPGGIREVEFVVQAQQLIRGGSDRRLQTQSLQAVLPRLEGSKLLSSEAVVALQAGYEFLRRTENRLQMFDDGQAHSLPADEPGRLRLATSMGHATWESFRAALDAHRERVAHHFQEVVFGPRAPMSSRSEAGTTELDALWQLQPDPARVREEVARAGVAEPAPVADALLALRDAPYFRRLDEFGKKRLATLLPRVLAELAGPGEAGALRVPPEAQVGTCQRVLRIIEAIGSRTSYLALLIENHAALSRLVEICRHGDFLADQVARFPLLLDELIDARIFQSLPDRAQFSHELDIRCEHVADDPERQVEALRQFQRAAMFRVATLDLTGRLPLMKVSDRLTDIAELILERAMRMAWDQITAVHGVPLCGAGEALREAGVAAVGYGKLGGMELGYGSDLDLVFLHDSAGEVQQTSGPKVVDNAVFFVRLGQRIVHLLTMHSNAGRLYEVDMRLRPSGKGGLIITNIEAFADYQRSEAWTWEHQALLHSRSVAGSPPIRAGFERIRLDTLANHVRRETLREEVRKMRERMRNELSRSKAGQFDMKQDPGGIADIEFLSQFWALYWAKDYPPVVTFSDTIRQLESVGSAALIDHRVIDLLRDTYRRYRQHAHHLSLEKGEPVVDGAPWEETRRAVADVWQRTMVAGNDPRPV